jgi:hypothetical protein
MSAISDIRHRHLLFRYQRQKCRTENCHADIGSVAISTSESIPIFYILKNFTSWIRIRTPRNSKRALYHLPSVPIWKRWDVGYRKKFYSDIWYKVRLHSLSPISEILISGSVRYHWSRISNLVPTYCMLIPRVGHATLKMMQRKSKTQFVK